MIWDCGWVARDWTYDSRQLAITFSALLLTGQIRTARRGGYGGKIKVKRLWATHLAARFLLR